MRIFSRILAMRQEQVFICLCPYCHHLYSCFTQSKYSKKFLFTTVELSKRTDRQRYGGDGWQLAFLDIDTMLLTMDTQRYNSPHLAHTLF